MSNDGKFIWYDLMTTDVKAAEAFYGKVVGWKSQESGTPGVDYMVLNAAGTDVGGMMALPQEARDAGVRPGWNGYIFVDDVDDMAKKFVAEGGKIHKGPVDIPTVGRFAMASDPQGTAVALFKPSGTDAPPKVAPGTRGHIGWRELHAGDGEKAFAFYSKHFGWTKSRAMPMGDMGVYQLFAYDGEDRGGVMTKMPQTPLPFWMFYFNVDGIDAAKAVVEQNGGKVINGPMEVPGGQWIVQCIDPQGAMFALVAPKR